MSISAGIKSRNGTGARKTSDFRSREKSEKTDQEQKEYSPEPLESIIRRVTAGEICYPENVPEITFGRTTKAELTDREHDVLRELIGGCTNEEIAQRLGITVNTVRYHIQNLLNKTGFENRLSLAVNAKVPGIVVNENDRQHFLNK